MVQLLDHFCQYLATFIRFREKDVYAAGAFAGTLAEIVHDHRLNPCFFDPIFERCFNSRAFSCIPTYYSMAKTDHSLLPFRL